MFFALSVAEVLDTQNYETLDKIKRLHNTAVFAALET